MQTTVRSLVFLWAAVFLLALASEVRADPPAIVSVISVKAKGDGSAYLKKAQEGKFSRGTRFLKPGAAQSKIL